MANTISRRLREFRAEAAKGDSYWIEVAKLQFAMALDERRQAAELSPTALANNAGVSAAHLTDVLCGDAPLSIEDLVRLARAAGGRLQISIDDDAAIEA